jgi:dTDP-4-amino-4,6-dideoxygalactose transaminase
MNPYIIDRMEPNFWLSCLLIDEDAMCKQERTDSTASYVSEQGKSCPTEILETLARYNAEGRPIWKPMHLQPIFRNAAFVAAQEGVDVSADIFARGLCLPSDHKMTNEQQDMIIELVKRCFD